MQIIIKHYIHQPHQGRDVIIALLTLSDPFRRSSNDQTYGLSFQTE